MNAAEITDKLGLHSLRNRNWYIQVSHKSTTQQPEVKRAAFFYLHFGYNDPARVSDGNAKATSFRGRPVLSCFMVLY